MTADLFTATVSAASFHARLHALPDDDRPSLAEVWDDRPMRSLPDPYDCADPFCPSAPARHLHGTRPDGSRM
jgi:hypothetical protein